MLYYIFNIFHEVKESQTIVFDCSLNGRFSELKKELEKFYTYNELTDSLLFISPDTKDLEPEIVIGLNTLLSKWKIKIEWYKYGLDGKIRNKNNEELDKTPITINGLLKIFKDNNGILESNQLFHYITPSGKHSRFFIRTGNILCNTSEILFIAFCLFESINSKGYKVIYYDTSSIAAIFTGFLFLRKLMGDQSVYNFENFKSYECIENDETTIKSGSLVIISASSSGDLIKKIQKKSPDSSIDFVTIITNQIIDSGNSLLNVNEHFPSCRTAQYKSDCIYCEENSFPVKISGEQFLPSKTYIQGINLSISDKPNWLDDFLRCFISKNIIKFNKEVNNKIREIYIDLEEFHKRNIDVNSEYWKSESLTEYQTKFYSFLENDLPTSTKLIIHLEDSASELIANQICDFIKKKGLEIKKPIVANHDNLNSEVQDSNSGNILIVASSIASGNKLYSISRDLRKYSQISLTYLICVCRTNSEKRSKYLDLNLGLRREGFSKIKIKDSINRNAVIKLIDIHIPDNHSKTLLSIDRSPWEQEKRFLNKLDASSTSFINNRYEQLSSTIGVSDKLFWYNPFEKDTSKRELKLRKNFAFYDFEKYNQVSEKVKQSDIYFIILAILHNLRTMDTISKKHSLIQHEHVKSILNPHNFTRFNDGILQSSILRAAKPVELDYSNTYDESQEMSQLILDLLKKKSPTTSEAILEFLYALSIRKLKVRNEHLKEVMSSTEIQNQPEEVTFMMNYIKEQILKT